MSNSILEQLAAELEERNAPKRDRHAAKTFLPMGAILSPESAGISQKSIKALNRKHTVAGTSNALGRGLNEEAFFVDCELAACIINAAYAPSESLLNVLPNRNTIDENLKVGFITGLADDVTGTEQEEPCDDPLEIDSQFSACKVSLPLGRNQKKTKTGEIDALIRRACRGLYDDFYFVGDTRGVSARPSMRFTANDRDLIIEGALMRAMNGKGRYFSRWFERTLWSGDPANNTAGGGYAEFIGLDLLTSGDYAADMAPYITGSTAASDCAKLSADVKDFGSECIGGGVNSIWEYMQEADHTVMMNGMNSGVTRGGLLLVMHPVMLKSFAEAIPCEMAGNGCNGANVLPNDGGNGLFNLDERNRILNQRTVTLNGATYRIVLDSSIPVANPAPGEYISTIYGLPLTLNNEEIFYTENVNYSDYMSVLSPVGGLWNESTGWTDGGNFFHTIERKQTCFHVTTKMEPRLVFKGSRYSWKITNVKACYLQDKEISA